MKVEPTLGIYYLLYVSITAHL